MTAPNGDQAAGPLELGHLLHVETKDGAQRDFEVVGVLQDPDGGASYAVLMYEPQDDGDDRDFIVTDMQGTLLEDTALAQEVLDEFLVFVEEAADDAEGGE